MPLGTTTDEPLSPLSRSRAGLVVITDERHDDTNLSYHCLLLKYVNYKLKIVNVMLAKAFFITRLDYADIRRQVRLLVDDPTIDWLVVTSTHADNDRLLAQLVDTENAQPSLEHLSPRLVRWGRRCFLAHAERFFDSFSQVAAHVMLNQHASTSTGGCNLKFVLNDQQHLDMVLSSFKNNDTITKWTHFKTSYSKYALEISSKRSLTDLPIGLKFDFFLNNNYLNADYLVYNFSLFTSSAASCSIDQDQDDLKFLARKIDLEQMGKKLAHSISTIEKTMQESNSGQTCVSLNGGKDCCVVLYLAYACALRLGYQLPLHVLFIKIENEFDEMDEFIFDELKRFYHAGHSSSSSTLDYIVMNDTTKTLKQNLFELKRVKPTINYILMGTRRTDSDYFKSMGEFAPTDADWPSFVRVNPILDWTYAEIWFFIRLFKLPYCELYNRGYTSIDTQLNTVPNPALFDPISGSFRPAYYLADETLERDSRCRRRNHHQAAHQPVTPPSSSPSASN